ncbi:MAG: M48 family metalloprotease [Myxococcales bacterium]|nr:M48 family metalloprotease [Myxococcales bacterium]
MGLEHLFGPLKDLLAEKWFSIPALIGVVGFLLYRIADFLQHQHTKAATQPTDLEKMTPEIFEQKKKRKLKRTSGALWKNTLSWGLQFGYVIGGIPGIFNLLEARGWSSSSIYTALGVIGWIFNMLVSKMFSLWTPALPFMPHAHNPRKTWTFGNAAWQAWGVASWSVPAYFFFSAMQQNGWVGSVAMIWVSQIIQLAIFIFTIKKQAVPYQQYAGLSPEFKTNLHAYLEKQGFNDAEVGVLKGLKMGPNAFATSLTPGYRQIVMTEELVEGFRDPQNPNFQLKLDDSALEAVIAHEVGHIKNYHVQKAIFWGGLFSSITTIAVYQIFGAKGAEFFIFDANTSRQITMFWGQSILNVTMMFLLNFIMIGVIRGNEYQADTHLLETNGCKKGDQFFHQIRHIAPVTNHPLWDRCNATHPAPEVREARIKEWQSKNCPPK